MVGKSAHGRKEKIGYYEHSWATKKNAHLTAKIFKCEPTRILAKKLEPMVINEVKKLLSGDLFARRLILEADKLFSENSAYQEIDRVKRSIAGYQAQLEALAERLSELPRTVSSKPIFNQMEKIEKFKTESEIRLEETKKSNLVLQKPAELREFKLFLNAVRELFDKAENPEAVAKIIKRLISKIEIGVGSLKIYFFVGSNTLTYGASGRT